MTSTGTFQPGVGAPEEKPAQVLRHSKTGSGPGSATWPVRIAVGDQVRELSAGARCVFALPQPPDPTPR